MYLRPPNTSQSMVPPYSATEVATAIGVSLDTFYRTRRFDTIATDCQRRSANAVRSNGNVPASTPG